jgi:hypothetical protein
LRLLQVPIFLCYLIATFCLGVLVLVALSLTFLYKKKGWPEEKDAINCWAFAIPKWLKSGTFENYIIVRKSEHSVVPHVQFCRGPLIQFIEECNPLVPRKGFLGFLSSFWHKGKIRKDWGEE